MKPPPNMSPTVAARAQAIALAIEYHTKTIGNVTMVHADPEMIEETATGFLEIMYPQ